MGRPTKWREQFIADMAREGQSIETARAFLRVGATLQRLAEAQCNGDFPCDNGERKVMECPLCGSLWHPVAIQSGPMAKEAHRLARLDGNASALKVSAEGKAQRACADCRFSARAKRMAPEGWSVDLQGDPRGCIITLKTPQGREIGVP